MLTKCISLGVSSGHLVNIANGVDTVKFNIIDKGSARANLEIDPDVKMLLFVGSLVPVKNISTLIKSFSLVMEKKTTANTKLYIVGSGFLEKKLKDLSVKLNLQEKIVFVGPVPHDTLPLWMSAADCLCLPSLSEGHPNVMMEALACGTPVVGSRVGSISDFIGGDRSNGYAVEPTNVSDIAEKLNAVLGFSYSRNQIRHTVLAYSWKNCAEKYYSALRPLI
ncbi:MAG: glycosyltransferase [Thiomicrorhabdus sp.]|nr:glycosyltransferase [Thiomicrorhabdus sp.]